jgi:hypothetical protein
MELLKKAENTSGNPREDNSDKKKLFSAERRPRTAAEHREDWQFIADESIRENISYQMQYLECQVYLYNDYQMYLTLESLHFKNIMTTLSGVIECALYAMVQQAAEKENHFFDDRTPFLRLIDDAFDMQIIDKDLKDYFHALRKMRNFVHISSIDFREYEAYEIDETNRYLQAINRFVEHSKHDPL